MPLKQRCCALLAVGWCATALTGHTQTPPQLTAPALTSNTLEARTPLTFAFDALPAGAAVVLRLGVADLSGLLRAVSATTFLYPADEVPFAPGSSELLVSLKLPSGELVEIKRVSVYVSDAGQSGTQESTANDAKPFTPKLDLAAPSAINKTTSTVADGSTTVTTSKTTTASMQAGLQLNSPFLGGSITGNSQVAGNSDRKQALRFNTAMAAAEKIDLASYALDWKNDSTAIGLGNANFSGQHPLLWQSSNRGAFVTQKLSTLFDAGFAAQNATPLVGLPNALGIYNAAHHFVAGVVGVELVPDRPKAIRLELFFVDAAQSTALPPPVPPDPNFDPLHTSTLRPCRDAFELQQILATGNTTTCDTKVAPVSQSQSAAFQASRSRGMGARLFASTADQSLRADLVWAKSRHEDIANSNTPGTPLATQNAWQADLAYEVVKAYPLTARLPLSVTTTAKLEYADPFYKSLPVGIQADYRQSTVAANVNLGALNANLNGMRRFDNVGLDATRLRNNLDSQNLNLNAPLGQMLAADPAKPDSLLPSVSINAVRLKQVGSHVPADVAANTVARSFSTNYGGALNWVLERWSVSYGVNVSKQDNQQIGSEDKDQKTLTTLLNGSWRPNDSWNITGNISPSRTTALDTRIVTTRLPAQIGANYNNSAEREGWIFLGNLNYERNRDSVGESSGKTFGANIAVGKRFLLPSYWGKKLPGEIQFRHSRNLATTRSIDPTTQVVSDTRQTTTVDMLDFTLSLF